MFFLQHQFRSLSIKKKIRIILICCVLLLVFTNSLSLLLLSKRHEKVLFDTVYENLLYASKQLNNTLDITGNLADAILADSVIQSELPLYNSSYTSPSERNQLQNHIYNVLGSHLFNNYTKDITYISILSKNNVINAYFSWPSAQMTEAVRTDLRNRGLQAEGATIWVTDYCQDYGLFLVKELRETKHFSFQSLGVLVICIDPQKLLRQSSVSGGSTFDSSYVLLDHNHLIYATDEAWGSEITELTSRLNNEYQKCVIGTESVFAVHNFLSEYGWDYICMIPYDSITDAISMTTRMVFLISMIAVFLILMIFHLLNSLFTPLNELIQKMQIFADGNFTRIDEGQNRYQASDETGQLHIAFNKMADEIISLIQQNYLNELLNKEAQLKSLESQMSPHFLYNTLDTIHWRAKMSGEQDIAKIASSLAVLLRMSLSRDSGPFHIRQELVLVDNYMAIQLLRHRRKLDYCITIPEELLNCEIPRFTIQPLVENAVQYGLHGITDDVCHITVTASVQEQDIEIQVKNNGSQFSESVLSVQEDSLAATQGLGIALTNINSRLKITYGEQYGVFLSNEEDPNTGEIYAIACIRIPQIDSLKN